MLLINNSLKDKFTPFGIIHTRDTLLMGNSYKHILQDLNQAPSAFYKEPQTAIDVHQKTAKAFPNPNQTGVQKSSPKSTISKRPSEDLTLKL